MKKYKQLMFVFYSHKTFNEIFQDKFSRNTNKSIIDSNNVQAIYKPI